jgi:hypothetical protein
MSTSSLQLIPTDPHYQPSQDAAERAGELLAKFVPRATEVNATFLAAPEFFPRVDGGLGVACPVCDTDALEWWHKAVETAYEEGFQNLHVTTPCCGAAVSLNDLKYASPAGFARFVLEASVAGGSDLQDKQLTQLSDTLGCELRNIRSTPR